MSTSRKFRRGNGAQHSANHPTFAAGGNLQSSVALLYQTVENLKDDFLDFADATNQQIREVVRGQEKQFTEFRAEMRLIANEFASSRKTNWPLLFGFAALFLTVIGGGWTIIKLQTENTVNPVVSSIQVLAQSVSALADAQKRQIEMNAGVRADLDTNTARDQVSEKDREKLNQHAEKIDGALNVVNTDISVIKANLREVETQFRAGDQARNVQFAEQQRMNSMLMQLTKSGVTYPPGPYYFPSISDGGAKEHNNPN